MEEQVTARDFILEVRGFLLNWDEKTEFFNRSKIKLGSFLHVAEDLKDTFNNFNKSTKTSLNGALGTAFNQIKKEFGKLDDGTEDQLVELIRSEIKVALAKIEGVTGGEMFDAYQRLCNADVIYDLLTSELHRLDPVIGDLGCQWRAPFVLDLHDAIHAYLADEGFSDDAINTAVQQYETIRTELPTAIEILMQCDRSATAQKSKKSKPVYTSKKIRPWFDQINLMCDELEVNAPDFYALKALIEEYLDNQWLADELPRPGFDPLDYIRICKLLTANRIRKLDEFGLSGIQDDYDVPDAKRTLGDCRIKMSNYSMTYMTYVCEQSCESIETLALDDDGYAYDVEDENRIHIVGSALKLMKDARFWTFQTSNFYKTNVCYGPTRAIFTRLALAGHPIIIDLRRLICTVDNNVAGGYRYAYNGGAILYFAPDQDGVFQFVRDEDVTVEQRAKVGMVCEACSMVLVDGTEPDENDPDRIFMTQDFDEYITTVTQNCNIVDLIMQGLSSHPELTTQIHAADNTKTLLSDDEVDALVNDAYLEATGRTALPVVEVGEWSLVSDRIGFPDDTSDNSDLLLEKAKLGSVLDKFGTTTSQYKRPVQGDRSMADRNVETLPFAPIHIYGSTYGRKCEELDEATIFIAENNVANDPNLGLRRVRDNHCRPRPGQASAPY